MNEHLFNENDFSKSIWAFRLIYCAEEKNARIDIKKRTHRNEKQKSLESSVSI